MKDIVGQKISSSVIEETDTLGMKVAPSATI